MNQRKVSQSVTLSWGFSVERKAKNEVQVEFVCEDEKRSQDQGAATNLSGLLYYLVFDE